MTSRQDSNTINWFAVFYSVKRQPMAVNGDFHCQFTGWPMLQADLACLIQSHADSLLDSCPQFLHLVRSETDLTGICGVPLKMHSFLIRMLSPSGSLADRTVNSILMQTKMDNVEPLVILQSNLHRWQMLPCCYQTRLPQESVCRISHLIRLLDRLFKPATCFADTLGHLVPDLTDWDWQFEYPCHLARYFETDTLIKFH